MQRPGPVSGSNVELLAERRLRGVEQALADARRELERERSVVVELSQRVAELEEALLQARAEPERLRARLSEAERARRAAEQRAHAEQARCEQLQDELEQLAHRGHERDQVRARLETARRRVSELERRLAERQREVDELEHLLAAATRARERAEQRAATLEEALVQFEAHLSALEQAAREREARLKAEAQVQHKDEMFEQADSHARQRGEGSPGTTLVPGHQIQPRHEVESQSAASGLRAAAPPGLLSTADLALLRGEAGLARRGSALTSNALQGAGASFRTEALVQRRAVPRSRHSGGRRQPARERMLERERQMTVMLAPVRRPPIPAPGSRSVPKPGAAPDGGRVAEPAPTPEGAGQDARAQISELQRQLLLQQLRTARACAAIERLRAQLRQHAGSGAGSIGPVAAGLGAGSTQTDPAGIATPSSAVSGHRAASAATEGGLAKEATASGTVLAERLGAALQRLREEVPEPPPAPEPEPGARAASAFEPASGAGAAAASEPSSGARAASAFEPASGAGAAAASEPERAAEPAAAPAQRRPWLASALRRLARRDPLAAGRLLVELLPLQRLVSAPPLRYDLQLSRSLWVQVTLDLDGRQRIARTGDPRKLAEVDFRLSGDQRRLGRMLRAGRLGWRVPWGRGRFEGDAKRGRAALAELLGADLELGELAERGIRLAPELTLALVGAMIPPAATRGQRFTIAHRTSASADARAALEIRDGRAPRVRVPPPADVPRLLITCPGRVLPRILAGEAAHVEPKRAVVEPSRAAVESSRAPVESNRAAVEPSRAAVESNRATLEDAVEVDAGLLEGDLEALALVRQWLDPAQSR